MKAIFSFEIPKGVLPEIFAPQGLVAKISVSTEVLSNQPLRFEDFKFKLQFEQPKSN